MAELDRLGWVVTHSYDVSGITFGVRTNSESFARWLEDTFASYRSDKEHEPRFSVLVADEVKSGKRFHLLYDGTRVHIRTRSLGALARALVSLFETFLLPARDDAVYAEMSVIAADGRTALAPPILLPLLETFSHRVLARTGLVLPAATTVAIDPSTGHVVPTAPVLDIPGDALQRLDHRDSGDGEPRVVVDRPLAVDAVLSFGTSDTPVEEISKAAALYRVASHSLNLGGVGAEKGLSGLRKVVQQAPCYGLGVQEWKRVPESIAAVLGA